MVVWLQLLARTLALENILRWISAGRKWKWLWWELIFWCSRKIWLVITAAGEAPMSCSSAGAWKGVKKLPRRSGRRPRGRSWCSGPRRQSSCQVPQLQVGWGTWLAIIRTWNWKFEQAGPEQPEECEGVLQEDLKDLLQGSITVSNFDIKLRSWFWNWFPKYLSSLVCFSW